MPLEGDVYIEILVEASEDRNQAIEREAAKLGVSDARELRMADTRLGFRFTGDQLALIQDGDDLRGDGGARLFESRIYTAKISIDVSATAHEFEVIFVHACSPSIW